MNTRVVPLRVSRTSFCFDTKRHRNVANAIYRWGIQLGQIKRENILFRFREMALDLFILDLETVLLCNTVVIRYCSLSASVFRSLHAVIYLLDHAAPSTIPFLGVYPRDTPLLHSIPKSFENSSLCLSYIRITSFFFVSKNTRKNGAFDGKPIKHHFCSFVPA